MREGSGDIEHLDATLASCAREGGALRLRLGQVLEVLGRGGVHELGFSSLGAYGVERCERSVRWVEAARCLARRVEALPELRRALAIGKVSWTMGELLARVATPANEARWLELAESRTVRQVQQHVERAASRARSADEAQAARALTLQPASGTHVAPGAVDAELDSLTSGDELCTLTCTVNREDAWLFEATRCLLDQLGERDMTAQVEALLAEAQGTLLALAPRRSRGRCAIDVGCLQEADAEQQRWVEGLRRCRAAAEAACEKNIPRELSAAPAPSRVMSVDPSAVAASLGIAPLEHATGVMLDRQVRSLSEALARHELELARLVLRFHRANGWRRLGYATEAQYGRERLGVSRSSLAARRALALRLEKLPGVAAALGANHIGVEAAMQLVRVATPKTEAAWIERASRRTIKHLREEVAAALVAVRMAREADCPPPEDTELAAFQKLEQAVVSGRLGHSRSPDPPAAARSPSPVEAAAQHVESGPEARRAWWLMLGSLASWLDGALQMPAAAAPRQPTSRACSLAGRVTLRLRMSRETCAWWRGLEAQARRWIPRGMSWLHFLCASFWQAWRHQLGAPVAYGHIYVRDRYRCTSPVCSRRDVTPHHIRFRSAGGSDEDDNITSACTWCHLHGLHGGRIRATGTAGQLCWKLGPRDAPCVIVHGRERMAA